MIFRIFFLASPLPLMRPPRRRAEWGGANGFSAHRDRAGKQPSVFENRPFCYGIISDERKARAHSGMPIALWYANMPIKAADFFTSVVKPTVEEFLRDTGDLRRGFLAAIVLYRMADYWDQENNPTKTSLSKLRQSLIKTCPKFVVIRDVADVSKHAQLRESKEIPRTLSSSEHVKVRNDLSSDGVSFFSYVPDVKFTLYDGSSGSLKDALRSVLLMWETMLKQP